MREYRILLEGKGDFRSDECISLISISDLIISNPPFSLFTEFIQILLESGKDYAVIGNKNALKYKDVFYPMKDRRMYLGHTVPEEFIQPDGSPDGKLGGLCRWFQNLVPPVVGRLRLSASYNPLLYPRYDNFDAIDVGRVSEIPCDYGGMMGVPITFFDKWNPEQFEIVGINQRWECEHRRVRYTESDCRDWNDCNASAVIRKGDRLERVFCRLLIRRIQ